MTDILDLLTPSTATDNDLVKLLLYEYEIPNGFPGSDDVKEHIANRKTGDEIELKVAIDGADSIRAYKIAEDEWSISYNIEDIDILLRDNYIK